MISLRLLALSSLLAGMAVGAFAGTSTTYSPFPPIVAAVEQSQRYVLPGGQVTVRASDGRGGIAYDRDTKYINGIIVGLVDDTIASVYWSVPSGSGSVSNTNGLSTVWTVPTVPGTYSITMYVNDGAIYGSGSDDATAIRTATVTVAYTLPARHNSARPTGSTSILLEWYAPTTGTPPGGYNVYRRTEGTAYSLVHQRTHTGSGPYAWTDTGRTEGVTYYYKVKVRNAANQELAMESPEIIATPQATQPPLVGYVANSYGNNVMVLDTITNTIYATIAVGPSFSGPGDIGPLGVTVASNGARAYVSNFNEDTASIIEAATNREVDLDNNSSTTSPATAVPGINRLSLRTLNQPQPKLRPDGVAVKSDSQGVDHLFAASFGGRVTSGGDIRGTVMHVRTSDVALDDLSSQYMFGHPRKVVLSPDGNELYVTDSGFTADDNAVVVFNVQDPTTPVWTHTIPLPAQNGLAPRPQGLTFISTLNGLYGYVVNTNWRTISVIDAVSKQLYGGISLDSDPALSPNAAYPIEVASSPNGKYVFVVGTQARVVNSTTWYYDSLVWMIDTATNTVVDSKPATTNIVEPFVLRGSTDSNVQPLYGAGRLSVTQQSFGGALYYSVYVTNFKFDAAPVAARGDNICVLVVDAQGIQQSQSVLSTGEQSGPGGIDIRPDEPIAPTDVTATSCGSGVIGLYWAGLPNATGYKIYRRQEGQSYGQPVQIGIQPSYPGSSMNSYTDTSVTTGTVYYYVIAAKLPSGDSPFSAEVSVIPEAGTIPWHRRNEVDGNGVHTGARDIIAAVRTLYADAPFDPGTLMVVGPDGSLYFEDANGAASVSEADGKYNPRTGEVTFSDGTSIQTPSDQPLPVDGPRVVSTFPGGSGPYRKVETAWGAAYTYQKYRGIRGTVYLVPNDDEDPIGLGTYVEPVALPLENRHGAPMYDPLIGPIYKSTKDIPYNYFGIDIPQPAPTHNLGYEGGVYWDDPTNGGTGAWRIYASARGVWHAFPGHGNPLVDILTTFDDGDAFMQMGFHPYKSDTYYIYVSQGFRKAALVVHAPGLSRAAAAAGAIVKVKRIHSIAQNLPDSVKFSDGYYMTNSYFVGTRWRDGKVQDPTGSGIFNTGFVRWGLAQTGDDNQGSFPDRNIFVSWLSPRDYNPFTLYPWETEDYINIDF